MRADNGGFLPVEKIFFGRAQRPIESFDKNAGEE
jgi:hypothetical protein